MYKKYDKSNPQSIKAMFNDIAEKYDLMNNIMTFFVHHIIKKKAVKLINPSSRKIIDICTGTGDIARYTAELLPNAQIKAVDFSNRMLSIAKQKTQVNNIEYIEADALKTYFPDNFFDTCTVGFGLRNIYSTNAGLKEINRILKPGGELIIIEVLNTKNRWLYPLFLDKAVPLAAKAITGRKAPYKYLIKSASEYYSFSEISELLSENNFSIKEHFSYFFSTLFLITAEKIR